MACKPYYHHSVIRRVSVECVSRGVTDLREVDSDELDSLLWDADRLTKTIEAIVAEWKYRNACKRLCEKPYTGNLIQ